MESLLHDLSCGSPSVQAEALGSLLDILRAFAETKSSLSKTEFPNDIFFRIQNSILETTDDSSFTMLCALLQKAMERFLDIHFYSLRNISKRANSVQPWRAERLFTCILGTKGPSERNLMTDMTLVKFEDDSCQPFRDLGAFRGEFNNFIFAFLPLLSPKSRRLLLAGLDHKILPNMSQPHLMSNYLFETFKIGGPTSILCLNGLFTLIREYNLDFPDFYDCLYSLLDGATFSCKYRVMFLDHLKLFLSSTMIPAYIIAGFLKKSCRLALASPTSMSAWVIPFTYNMLLVHPACRVLIHREMTESWTDPFDPNEKSLRLCRALESSLWEIKALDSHFWPRIAKLSSILRDRFVRPPFDLASIAMDIEGSLSAEEAQKELSHTWSKSPPLGLEISANFFEF